MAILTSPLLLHPCSPSPLSSHLPKDAWSWGQRRADPDNSGPPLGMGRKEVRAVGGGAYVHTGLCVCVCVQDKAKRLCLPLPACFSLLSLPPVPRSIPIY